MTVYPKAYDSNAQLWFAKQIVLALADHLFDPHPLSRSGDLTEKIQLEFEKTFPGLNYSDYLTACIREREESLKLVQKYHAIDTNNHIDLTAYLRNRIGANPNLSTGISRHHLTKSLPICRAELYEEINHIARSVLGVQMDNNYLAQCVTQIQRHTLTEPAPELLYDPEQSIPAQLMQLQLLTIPSSEFPDVPPTDMRVSLVRKLLNSLGQLQGDDVQNISFQISQNVAILTQEKQENLWPDLIRHKAFLMDLVKKFPEGTSTQNMIQTLEDTIDLAESLPPDMQDLSQPTIEEFFKRKKHTAEFLKVVQYLGFSTFMKSVPQARSIKSFDLDQQLKFFVAAHLNRSYPDWIMRLIETWTEKKFSETLAPPDDLVTNITQDLCSLVEYAQSIELDDQLEDQLETTSCSYFEQDDMVWATLPPPAANEQYQSFAVFDHRCPLFVSLREVFMKYCSPHPLLARKHILQEWQENYCQRRPLTAHQIEIARDWAERYLKYMWYTAPRQLQITKFKNLSTIDLFLEWHAADLILKGVTDRKELVDRLENICKERIPSFPVDPHDIENTVFRMLHDHAMMDEGVSH